jgi:hypothetical protein
MPETSPEGFSKCPTCGGPISGYAYRWGWGQSVPLGPNGERHRCPLAIWRAHWLAVAKARRRDNG